MIHSQKISGTYSLINGDIVYINAVSEPCCLAGPYGPESSVTDTYIEEVTLQTTLGQAIDITYFVVEFGLDGTLIDYCS